MIKTNKYTYVPPSVGSRYLEGQYKLMRELKSGDTLYIQDFKLIGPDGAYKTLLNFEFIIK